MRDSMHRRPLKRSKKIPLRPWKCFTVNLSHFHLNFKMSQRAENKAKHEFWRGECRGLWKTSEERFYAGTPKYGKGFARIRFWRREDFLV